MVNELQSYNSMVPLHAHSITTLLPRTFNSEEAPKLNNSDDLESIHNFMKSMALRSPNKLFEKAKAIVDGGAELVTSKFASFAASDNEAVAKKGTENPQERRPALGRKRARFSFKPNTNQPSVSLDPSLDIDQLQDPGEYFLAHEKLENAKKELQRQRGGNMIDLNDYNPSTNARRRRPGILGKSVSFKHLYSSVISEDDDVLLSSQGALQQDLLSQSNYDLQQETTNHNVKSQEKELAGSIGNTEKRANALLDELLSSNIETLDEDGTLSLLQERLQIKSIDLDKLCLPEFHDLGRTDFVVLGEKLPKAQNTPSDINNLVKGLSVKTSVRHKQVAESSVHPLASPTPPKSPFASTSLLKKRILQSNTSSDPFSALNFDLSPARNLSSVEVFDRQADQVAVRSISGRLKSPVEDEITNTTTANTGSQKMIRGDSIHLREKSVDDNLSKLGVGIGIMLGESHGDLKDHDGSNMDERVVNDSVSRPNVDTAVWTYECNEMGKNAEDMPQEAVSSAQPDINVERSARSSTDNDVQKHGSSEIKENVKDMPWEAPSFAKPGINIEDSTMENLNHSRTHLGQSNSTSVEVHALDGPSATLEIAPEKQNEVCPRISLNERSKAGRLREGRQRKVLSRRQSLAEAGSLWNSGVRRSSRIKRRPLEYWKGERFLYGRVHDSLPTVIGLKYVSPAKGDGKPTFRVHSYVSDDYKELVELAALH